MLDCHSKSCTVITDHRCFKKCYNIGQFYLNFATFSPFVYIISPQIRFLSTFFLCYI